MQIDRIQEKLEPNKSSVEYFCNKNISEDVHNGNDDKVKINKNFVNLSNAVVKIKKTKKRMIKCHTKYSNSKKNAIRNFLLLN